jgi:hypothetical protein
MEFEDFRARVQAERKIRAQRDATQRAIPNERLRREIREAFARESARAPGDDREVGVPPRAIRATTRSRDSAAD